MRLPVMCLETEWLLYIQFLFHYTIQESSLDIHLVYLLLVVEPNLPNPEILFSCVCTLGVLYTHSPCLRVWGKAPEKFFWDVCWKIGRAHV